MKSVEPIVIRKISFVTMKRETLSDIESRGRPARMMGRIQPRQIRDKRMKEGGA